LTRPDPTHNPSPSSAAAAGRAGLLGMRHGVESLHADVASVQWTDVVVAAVVVAPADDLRRRCCGRGEFGSGRVMVGSRLLRADAERALSSSLSPGMLVRQLTLTDVILWGRERGPEPPLLEWGTDPILGVYKVRNFAFKTSNAEMQSTNCNVIC